MTTTQVYLSRLDVTRVYRDAYTAAAPDTDVPGTGTFRDEIGAELAAEFDDDDEASG